MNKTKKIIRDPVRHLIKVLPEKQTWEAFTYLWTNKTLNRIYVGYHLGKENDNYVCSSKSDTFRKDWDNPNNQWERTILFRGSAKDASDYEHDILSELNMDDQSVYNMGCYRNSSYSQEVRDKMGEKQARVYWLNSMYADEPIEKITNLYQWCKYNDVCYTTIYNTLIDVKAPYVDGMYLTRADGDYIKKAGRGDNMDKINDKLTIKEPVQANDDTKQIRYDNYVQAVGCMWSGETDPAELILVDIDTKEDVTSSIINNRTDYGFYKDTDNCFVLGKKAYNELLTIKEADIPGGPYGYIR